MTGQPDALTFLVDSLGFEQAIKVLPFRPGRHMPDAQLLARKRGLSITTMAAMSRRARIHICKGMPIR